MSWNKLLDCSYTDIYLTLHVSTGVLVKIAFEAHRVVCSRKVDVKLPGKGNSNFHGARKVHLVIKMLKWIRTSRLSIKNSLSVACSAPPSKAIQVSCIFMYFRVRFEVKNVENAF